MYPMSFSELKTVEPLIKEPIEADGTNGENSSAPVVETLGDGREQS